MIYILAPAALNKQKLHLPALRFNERFKTTILRLYGYMFNTYVIHMLFESNNILSHTFFKKALIWVLYRRFFF